MQFYGRFASAYGTLVFAVFLVSLFATSRIQLGLWAYYGFPILALCYAVVRHLADEQRGDPSEEMASELAE